MLIFTSEGLWDLALTSLVEKDRQQFDVLKPNKLEILNDVLAAANQKKSEALKKQWKFTHKGKTYIIRDFMEKIIVWIDRFKTVGDQAVQYDPAHAALPWACVRFLIQAAVDSVRNFGIMMENMSHIANLITRCAILEDLYLGKSLKIEALLQKSHIRLYATILGYLAKAMRYYSAGTIKNMARDIFSDTATSVSTLIIMEQAEADRCAALASAELQDAASNVLRQAQNQQTTGMMKLLQDLQAPIIRIGKDICRIQGLDEEAERVKIMKSISTIPYPSHHKTFASGRVSGSGKWLLQNKDFLDWRGSSSSTILWLHGMPGCGKTKLCSIVIDDLKTPSAVTGMTELVTFFYCIRDPREPARGQSLAVIRSILRQVVSAFTNVLLPAKATYDAMIEEGFGEREWTMDECIDTLVSVMETCPSITIIVDALDECEQDERMSLLSSLKDLRDRSANLVKIFISSRDDVDLFAILDDASDIHIHAGDNADDIKQFISERVDSLMKMRNSRYGVMAPELQEEVESVLGSGAKGM